jgi:amidophosphoribosyltransferase
MVARDRRHINTSSDTEILLNVFADELQRATTSNTLTVDAVFAAVAGVHQRVRGSYAVVALVAGLGLLAFRDPHGIRPLCLGTRHSEIGKEWMVASESVALEGSGFQLERDIAPGEAIIIDLNSQHSHAKKCAPQAAFTPCMFEYVYLARPDSCIDNVPVYDVRLRMGDYLAEKILRELSPGEVDVVMPIPDSSRPAAMQVAKRLGVPYREGFYKNRYVGRTFIMPGQAIRKKSVRQKLNAMPIEFKGKCVLIVDDSIVRGTTSQEIIQMARDAGAARVIFASAAPPVRFPNVYGIDMPTRSELVAHGRSLDEIRAIIGADQLIYQDLADLKQAICDTHAGLENFESSCFDGIYVTGDIDAHYLDKLEALRHQPKAGSATINDGPNGSHLHLQQHFSSE